MIFVTVGTAKNNLNRLFIAIDQLAADRILTGVIAQIGHSTYEPRHCRFSRFFSSAEMSCHINNAEFIICHGGVATLDECLGQGKKVIVTPRLASYNEAADDHQLEIVSHLAARNRVLIVFDMAQLKEKVEEVGRWEPKPVSPGQHGLIVEIINGFIEGCRMEAKKD